MHGLRGRECQCLCADGLCRGEQQSADMGRSSHMIAQFQLHQFHCDPQKRPAICPQLHILKTAVTCLALDFALRMKRNPVGFVYFIEWMENEFVCHNVSLFGNWRFLIEFALETFLLKCKLLFYFFITTVTICHF